MSKSDKKNNRKNVNNNGGFSLIEVLVAVVILAILSIMVISVFTSSAKINNKARKQESANTVVQLMTERLKGLDINTLVSSLDDAESGTYPFGLESYSKSVSEKTGETVYVFNSTSLDSNGNVYIDGVSTGDKFYASIELNPDDYSDKATPDEDDKEKNNINSDMPGFNDVLTDDNCVVLRQISQHDIEVANAFNVQGQTIASKNVTVKQNINSYSSVFQEIDMTITYKSSGGLTKTYTYELENFDVTQEDVKPKNFYLFYKPYSNMDKVTFEVINPVTFKKDLNIYLIQQTSDAAANEFKWNNVSFVIDAHDCLTAENANTTQLGVNKNVNFYSNVSGIQNGSSNSVTHNKSENSEIKYLYNMQVKIWVNEAIPADKSGAYLTITSTKEN